MLKTHFPYAEGGLDAALDALEDDAVFLEQYARTEYKKIKGETCTPVEFWKTQPRALIHRLLRLWLSELLNSDFIPDFDMMERFCSAIHSPENEPKHILSAGLGENKIAVRSGQVLFVSPSPPSVCWDYRKQPRIQWGKYALSAELNDFSGSIPKLDDKFSTVFDADEFPAVIRVEAWEHADKMIPFDAKTPKNMKKIFTDAHIGSAERFQIPLFKNADSSVVWVPGVKHSDFAKITNQTRKIVSFRAQEDR